MRTISLNCSYLILFNNLRHKKQIKFLGTQLFPDESKFFGEILTDIFNNQQRGYLITDLLPKTIKELRLRTIDFNNNTIYVYI
jgi:hypothetical protein